VRPVEPKPPRYPEQGKRLQALRAASGKSKNQVIDESKISRPTYFDLEKGERRLIEDHAKALAPVLGVPVEDLVALGLIEELSPLELAAAAEIAAEQATPEQTAKLVYRAHFRKGEIPADKEAEFVDAMAKLIQALDD
jgi:transcriptional regulator with XRE-family HTH domain